MTFQLETRSLVEAVSEALRERILTGEIAAGEALNPEVLRACNPPRLTRL